MLAGAPEALSPACPCPGVASKQISLGVELGLDSGAAQQTGFQRRMCLSEVKIMGLGFCLGSFEDICLHSYCSEPVPPKRKKYINNGINCVSEL